MFSSREEREDGLLRRERMVCLVCCPLLLVSESFKYHWIDRIEIAID